MAAINTNILRVMQQHQLQQWARAQMEQQMALPPSGMYGLGGLTGQARANPYLGNSLAALANQPAQAYSATASVPKDPVKIEYPEKGVHDHLQRRVNKWLSGVNLPLH